MLDAIEETHKSGFIHRDIKAVSIASSDLCSQILCSVRMAPKYILLTLDSPRSIWIEKENQFLLERKLTLEELFHLPL